MDDFRRLEIGGGRAVRLGSGAWRLSLPPVPAGYGDAQIQDYGGRRDIYPWQPGVELTLEARYSHSEHELRGTAGFGFWNAPWGDPSVRWPALPQATWFFFAAPPNDLPFARKGPGRGWFAGTVDAGTWRARLLAPLAPPVLLLNQWEGLRRRIWPWVRRQLQISYQPLGAEMTEWHRYRLSWRAAGCRFRVDERLVLDTPYAPRGPLGFVCWVDNQYLVATPTGRVRWGATPTTDTQWLEIRNLSIEAA